MEFKMRKKISLVTFFAIIFILVGFFSTDAFGEPEECTVLIAGRKTTVDGSILFGKSEDDGPKEVDFLWYVPRKIHEPGSVVKLKAGGTIPQVKETYAYFWDQCPGTPYSNGIVNEWGIAFGSNGCISKEDSVKEVEARGDLVKGGLGFMLRIILAERAKTAREAVEMAANLLDKYGYNASGRNLNIVGPNEAWQLQMVRGKNYVARRVRNDEVAIIANTFSIRDVDMNDKKNFICSPTLISYAVQRGWYDPEKEGTFDFAKVYAPEQAHKRPGNTFRQWMMAKLLKKNFPLSPEESTQGLMPVSVKPDRKLSLRDVMTIFRNHYEGTSLDKSGFTQTKEYETSPHKTDSTICNYGTHRTTVVQQRDWLPPAIGTVVWRALDEPCSSGFVPWYLGATDIPEPFRRAPESFYTTQRDLLDYHFKPLAETWDLGTDLESASGVFTHLGRMVDANYNKVIHYVKKEWQTFEDRAFALQPAVEKTALELYKKDKTLAAEYLNLYTFAQALKSLKKAKEMLKTIKDTLWTGRDRIKPCYIL
jgi:dipeptidase